jgi:hypothetical protein
MDISSNKDNIKSHSRIPLYFKVTTLKDDLRITIKI